MKILLLHQNFPGQFGRLAQYLASDEKNSVVCLGEAKEGKHVVIKNGRTYWYNAPDNHGEKTHHYLQEFEANIRRGQTVYRALRTLKQNGFYPDVVYGHAGWGETLFIKDVYPKARLVCYFEFYYNSKSSDFGFDPEFPVTEDDALKVRAKNATHLLAFESCDHAISPTKWQYEQFPAFMRSKISVVHDGIDTEICRSNPDATYRLKDSGIALTKKDTILTYCARNLEPYRGFHSFIRALPKVLEARKDCRVLIIGGDGVSYGRRLPNNATYREKYCKEVNLSLDRTHFLGAVPYADYLSIMQLSSAHVYLTYPFVLSWSFLEALSIGCNIVASDTSPVQEVIQHGEQRLAPFFDHTAISDAILGALDDAPSRAAAQQELLKQYDFRNTRNRILQILLGDG